MAIDFSNGKRGPVVQPDPNKTRITIRLDTDIIDHFKRIVNESGGGNYQTLISDALGEHMKAHDGGLEKVRGDRRARLTRRLGNVISKT